jgi:5-formyltetrahydrofolate cyclo-ligase
MALISNYKNALRKTMLDARDSLHKELLTSLSNIIQYRILALEEFRKAEIIGAYYSIGSEVNTSEILEFALKHKILALPKGDAIRFVKVDDLNNLIKGRYNIMEAVGDTIEPDLVLVPAIAFDEEGYRIGYGKGYYDKYLSKHNCYSIGLAYDFQILKSIPHDRHDISVNMIVTDKRIISIS